MNKCPECGFVFDDDDIMYWEEQHGLEHGPFEKFCGCPNCGSVFESGVKLCESCNEWFAPDELYSGLCSECVKKQLTVPRAKRFLIEQGMFVEFVMFELCDVNSDSEDSNDKLFDMASDYYFRRLAEDGFDKMLQYFYDFIFVQDESWGCEQFSAWIAKEALR